MIAKSIRSCTIGLAIVSMLPLLGCLTNRQVAKLTRRPRNVVFKPTDAVPLTEGETHAFYEYDRGGSQSLFVLQLAADARLKKRYHEAHDLVLTVVRGSAIVQVEDTRYTADVGAAVVLPRYTAYSVLPTGGEELLAVLTYTPAFHGKDVVVVE